MVRGFDSGSRRDAQDVRTRLTHEGIAAVDVAAPLLAANPTRDVGEHACAYVGVNDAGAELERIAALTRTPLVVACSSERSAPPAETAEHVPVMRAARLPADSEAGRTFPSAVGRVPDIAFNTFVVMPNQPEAGELTVHTDDAGDQHLASGTTVSLRLLSDAIQVEAIDVRGDATAWSTHSVRVTQRSGIHRVVRDGLLVADLADRWLVRRDDAGLRVHHA